MHCIMLQGTGSNVGKSLLVAGLCRLFRNRGYRVAPFKPQNMSNNSSVTIENGEIGRAQALQALACGVEPSVHMNPVLLKPQSEAGAQVIVQGGVWSNESAAGYTRIKPALLPLVLDSFQRLRDRSDIVIVEGAGSPAETNLRTGDIANMGFAQAANVPVVLIGDIDRGGVIAQLVGTWSVLDPRDRQLVKGFVVNKFRGDASLFAAGYRRIAADTGWSGLGLVPWFSGASSLPSEDSVDLQNASTSPGGKLKIACLMLPRISNFDDLDPLALEEDCTLQMISPDQAIPAGIDLVILPGSKSTMSDLEYLRRTGWDHDLISHVRRGGSVLGICGGYQMLGSSVCDPEGFEGQAGVVGGLGLLNVASEMENEKTVSRRVAKCAETEAVIEAYEIHIGKTNGVDCQRPFAWVRKGKNWRPDGAVSQDGRVFGTYLHGLFKSNDFRRAFLARFGAARSILDYDRTVDQSLNALARHLEAHIDISRLATIARGKTTVPGHTQS